MKNNIYTCIVNQGKLKNEIMKNSTILNENETLVLNALNAQAKEYTGGQFGSMYSVSKCGMSDKQFAGYISALEAKDVFEYNDKNGGVYGGQYAINTEWKN